MNQSPMTRISEHNLSPKILYLASSLDHGGFNQPKKPAVLGARHPNTIEGKHERLPEL
jgi:hypothetical protein